MPYIHWETEPKLLNMTDYIKSIIKEPKTARSPGDRHEFLIQAYLNPDPEQCSPLHIRRTLDQYYYYSLEDTTERDKSQLISRMFKEKKLEGEKYLIMVDQLWIWILDRGEDTVLLLLV